LGGASAGSALGIAPDEAAFAAGVSVLVIGVGRGGRGFEGTSLVRGAGAGVRGAAGLGAGASVGTGDAAAIGASTALSSTTGGFFGGADAFASPIFAISFGGGRDEGRVITSVVASASEAGGDLLPSSVAASSSIGRDGGAFGALRDDGGASCCGATSQSADAGNAASRWGSEVRRGASDRTSPRVVVAVAGEGRRRTSPA
jgi:hypothetical protein